MLKTFVLLILSFFAVIGFTECILSFLETVSTSKYAKLGLTITAHLSGSVDNVTFLLNTLLLQAERLNYKNDITRVLVVDDGLDENTYSEVYAFCLENDNITIEK